MKRIGYALAAAVIGIGLLNATPARAQYTNPYTGRTFNNPVSNLLDTAILNKRWEILSSSSMTSAMVRAEAARREGFIRAGNLKIKRGTATTRFTPSGFNVEAWMKRWNPKTPADRRALYDEYVTQKDIWTREARARGTNLNDMAECLALTFVLAYEVHSGGERAGDGAYKWMVGDFRRSLLKDAYYQGLPAAEKQYLLDTAFLNSTNPVRLWRLGTANRDNAMLAKAREQAKAHLTRWWDEPVDNLRATPNGFVTRK